MSAFTGKWKKVSADNTEAFLAATGLQGDSLAKVRGLFEGDVEEELQVTGNNYSRTTIKGSVKTETSGQFGQPVQKDGAFGTIKVVTSLVSDSKILITDEDNRAGKLELSVSGNSMTAAWTINGVTGTRTFAKQ